MNLHLRLVSELKSYLGFSICFVYPLFRTCCRHCNFSTPSADDENKTKHMHVSIFQKVNFFSNRHMWTKIAPNYVRFDIDINSIWIEESSRMKIKEKLVQSNWILTYMCFVCFDHQLTKLLWQRQGLNKG